MTAQAAIEQAVKESVEVCVARLTMRDTDAVEQISHLRQRVNDIVASLSQGRDGSLQKMANKLLHTPTRLLREGGLSGDDIVDVVRTIEKELISASLCKGMLQDATARYSQKESQHH